MSDSSATIRYLIVTHIPFSRLPDGTVILDELWANDLKEVRQHIGPIRVAAPELPIGSNQATWGPTAVKLDPSTGISFAGFPPMKSSFDLPSMFAIRSLLNKEVKQADLVHTSNLFHPYLNLLYAHEEAVRLKKKTLFVIAEDYEDMLSWEWIRTAPTQFQHWYRQLQLSIINQRVRKAAASATLTFLFTPAAVDKFRLITPNGIAVRDTTHEAQDVISETALAAKCKEIEGNTPLTIVSASRHNPIKGNDLLIRAIAELKKRNIPVRVLIYGHGKLTKELQSLTKELKLEDQITFPGALKPGKDVYEAIARGHIFAMPHRTNDFARAFYDAMAGGTPVIAFSTPASDGTVRDGVDGLLAPLDNVLAYALAIARVHQDRKLLINMSQQARVRALSETRTIWHGFRAELVKELFRATKTSAAQ